MAKVWGNNNAQRCEHKDRMVQKAGKDDGYDR